MPLTAIFDRYLPKSQKIDFLSIDIEGMEEQVFSTLDWANTRPAMIACEVYGSSLAEIARDGVSGLLISNGYELFSRVNLVLPNVNTVFFVDKTA